MTTTTIYRIGHHPNRPERLALIREDQTAEVWFGQDETLEEAQAKCRKIGMTLKDDGTLEWSR